MRYVFTSEGVNAIAEGAPGETSWAAIPKTQFEFSLCNLCVLCDSVVNVPLQTLTTETQRTPRMHGESADVDTLERLEDTKGLAHATLHRLAGD